MSTYSMKTSFHKYALIYAEDNAFDYGTVIGFYLCDIGVEKERRPLVAKVPGLSPVISGF